MKNNRVNKGNRRYEELAKGRIKPTCQLVVSKDNEGQCFKLTELLEVEEIHPVTQRRHTRKNFARGGIYIDTLDGLIAVRDALNVALDKLGYAEPCDQEPLTWIGEHAENKVAEELQALEVGEFNEELEVVLYEKMSRIKLIEECRSRNLNVTTKLKKAEYIELLIADDKQTAAATEASKSIPDEVPEEPNDWSDDWE